MRYDRAQLKTPHQVSIITCLTALGTGGINDLFSEVFNSNHAENLLMDRMKQYLCGQQYDDPVLIGDVLSFEH